MPGRVWMPPIVLIALLGCARVAAAQSPAAVTGPAAHVFASPGGTELKAYVFINRRAITLQVSRVGFPQAISMEPPR